MRSRVQPMSSRFVRTVIPISILLWASGCSVDPLDPHDSPTPHPSFVASAPASEPITVEFEGTVTAVTDPAGELEGRVGVGEDIYGLFVYDETAPDEHPQPDVGRYRFREGPYVVGVKTDHLWFSSGRTGVDITIRLTNDKKTSAVRDQFEVKSTLNSDPLPGVGVASIDVLLVDDSATALSSDALAGQCPNAAAWIPTRTVTVTGADGWTIDARIELLAPSDPNSRRKKAEDQYRAISP